MSKTEFMHNGLDIVIDEPNSEDRPLRAENFDRATPGEDTPVHVEIDGDTIEAVRDADGRYYTRQLPYQDFGSSSEMAKTVVEESPDFYTRAGDED